MDIIKRERERERESRNKSENKTKKKKAIFFLDLTLMHPLWIHRSRAEYSYMQLLFFLQSTLKLPKFSISRERKNFLSFNIYC